MVIYGTYTVPVKDPPGAERVIVKDGKITQMSVIFDRRPSKRRARPPRPDRAALAQVNPGPPGQEPHRPGQVLPQAATSSLD
jgi:hypothetical protein